MNAQHKVSAIGVAVVVTVLGSQTQAQFTGNNQTNTISGVTNNWAGSYIVGSNYVADVLLVQNAGVLSNGASYIGYATGASNNAAIVSSTGSIWSSVWRSDGSQFVGYSGAGNSLVISNGGGVVAWRAFLGYNSSASNNTVRVTGYNSRWYLYSGDLYVGTAGGANSLVVSNRGVVTVDQYVRIGYNSSNNVVVVTDSGTLLCNFAGNLFIGGLIGGNSLVVSGRGYVECGSGILGSSTANNKVLVTDTGSVWRSTGSLYLGEVGSANSLVVSNGGRVLCSSGNVGTYNTSSRNTVMVTGPGSLWSNTFNLSIGYGGYSNTLTIANGGAVAASNAFVGVDQTAVGNRIDVTGGAFATDTLVIGRLGQGTFTLNGGTVTVGTLVVTNNIVPGHGNKTTTNVNVLVFTAGTLHSQGTAVTNAQPFVVGNGTASAIFHLGGGVHSFNNGLRIRANSFLTGCGTINGTVVVDAGGTVQADCSPLVFNQSVTNNGTMRAVNDSVLEAYGSVVNNSVLDLITGTTNFHSSFLNAGSILTSNDLRIVDVSKSGDDIHVKVQSFAGHNFQLQQRDSLMAGDWTDVPGVEAGTGDILTLPDSGGATNSPSRFYRVRVAP